MVHTDLGSQCATECSRKGRQGLIFLFMVYITPLSINKACGVQPNGMFQMFPTSVPKKKKTRNIFLIFKA